MTSRKIAVVVMCACLLMIGGVWAQEPEPTPTETPTLVPTDTPTNTDTPSPIPTDTATSTSTYTLVPTDTPTSTATATSVEVTPEVTDPPPVFVESLSDTPTSTPRVKCSPGIHYLGGDGLGDLNYVVNDSYGTTVYNAAGDYLQNVSTVKDTGAFVTVDFTLPVGWTSVTINYTIDFTRGYLPGSTFFRLYRRGSPTAAWEGAQTAPGGFSGRETYSWTLTPTSIGTTPSYLGLSVQSNNGDPNTGYARVNWIEVCGVTGTATPTPTLTPTNTATSTPTDTPTNTPTPTPECEALRSIYDNRMNQQENVDFASYLISNSNFANKEACWRILENLMFTAMRHEIGENQDHYNIRLATPNDSDEITALQGELFAERGTSVTSQEVSEAFSTAPETVSTYYLFARVMLNGMSNTVITGFDPLNYFASNFNSTLSDYPAGCQLKYIPAETLDRDFDEVCVDLPSWNNEVYSGLSNPEYLEVYNIYIPYIRSAINDYVLGIQDPTQGAFGIRPINRRWSNVIRNPQATNPQATPIGNTNLGPVAPNDDPFVFRTYLTRVVDYSWSFFTFINANGRTESEYYITSPTIYISPNTLLAANLSQCTISNETIAEAYMRNLRESVYGDSTYNNLPNFPPENRNYFNIDGQYSGEIRFGLSDTETYGLIIHSLVAERYPTTATTEPDSINVLSWQTFVFNRTYNPAAQEPANKTIRLLTGSEIVAVIGGVRVEPVSCS